MGNPELCRFQRAGHRNARDRQDQATPRIAEPESQTNKAKSQKMLQFVFDSSIGSEILRPNREKYNGGDEQPGNDARNLYQHQSIMRLLSPRFETGDCW